jgi:hypothetical protein
MELNEELIEAINSMIISYSADDYIVGENEIWKLTWKSPYEDSLWAGVYWRIKKYMRQHIRV